MLFITPRVVIVLVAFLFESAQDAVLNSTAIKIPVLIQNKRWDNPIYFFKLNFIFFKLPKESHCLIIESLIIS
jgi:hypothetical protein